MNLPKAFRRFRRKHRSIRIVIVTVTIVVLWRGVWSILDAYLPSNDVLNISSIAIAILILYLDDFHLKELL